MIIEIDLSWDKDNLKIIKIYKKPVFNLSHFVPNVL